MKKIFLALMLGMLLIGTNLYAGNGDLIVDGQVGIGTSVANAKVNINSSIQNFGLSLLQTRDTNGPAWGASLFVFLDGTSGAYSQEAGGFTNSTVYRRQTSSDSNSLIYAGLNQALIGIEGGVSGNTVNNLTGLLVVNGMTSQYEASAFLTNGYGIVSRGLQKNGKGDLTVNNFRHVYLQDKGTQLGASTLSVISQTGLWVDKQAFGTSNYGIVLNGDGAIGDYGAAVVLGDSQNAFLYGKTDGVYVYDGTAETKISPHDPETGEWIFYSKNIKTGRTLRVNMEELVRDMEKLTGKKYLIESFVNEKYK